MGQLSSPTVSAKMFAKWLVNDYNNPDKPLSSLQLLISDTGLSQFTLPNGTIMDIERATHANVKAAILDWYKKGNLSKENMLIFYFCGHGLARGSSLTILLEDFGENDIAPFQHSIDFTQMHDGMEKSLARHQCYFVDACRNASSLMLASG